MICQNSLLTSKLSNVIMSLLKRFIHSHQEAYMTGRALTWGENHCFACDKLMKRRFEADTRDGQIVHGGPDGHKRLMAAGEAGDQPPKGGPRLYHIVT